MAGTLLTVPGGAVWSSPDPAAAADMLAVAEAYVVAGGHTFLAGKLRVVAVPADFDPAVDPIPGG